MYKYLIIACLILNGCATPKVMQATGGSRSDGTVTMSYAFGGFEKPVVDFNRGRIDAQSRCQAWGYDSAESFGGVQQTCLAWNGYGCTRWQNNHVYQCTKRGESVRPEPVQSIQPIGSDAPLKPFHTETNSGLEY